jgi:hypothetical protein
MEDVSPETITTADIILSIVPPGEAVIGAQKSYFIYSKDEREILNTALVASNEKFPEC